MSETPAAENLTQFLADCRAENIEIAFEDDVINAELACELHL